jgi:hypothetical protein
MLTPEQIQRHLETLEEASVKGFANEERMSELLSLSEFEITSVLEAMCPALYNNIVGPLGNAIKESNERPD